MIQGEVAHRRRSPRENAFRYPAFCLRLPLSRLEGLDDAGIAHNRRGLVSFHDRDHGADELPAVFKVYRGQVRSFLAAFWLLVTPWLQVTR